MSEARKHPDVFDEREALEYLHVADVGTDRTMEKLRQQHNLPSFRIGNKTLYHRAHLDAFIARTAGFEISGNLRIANG